MDYGKLPTQELIGRCIAQDERAWEEFVHRMHAHILATVAKAIREHSKIPSHGLVKDLYQETYCKLFDNGCKALVNFKCEHEKAIFAYVGKIARSAVHDYYRKLGNRIEHDDLDPGLPSNESMERRSRMEAVIECLQRELANEPEEKREREISIFQLYYWQGFSARQIGEIFDLPTKSVENILLKLVRVVRRRLNPDKK